LQKLAGQASGATADAISVFDKKVGALLGGGGGFLAPLSPNPTLSRANGEAATLYAEIGRAEATPTPAQWSAVAGTEKAFAEVSAQWKKMIPEISSKVPISAAPGENYSWVCEERWRNRIM
jgi:hypothetical protein